MMTRSMGSCASFRLELCAHYFFCISTLQHLSVPVPPLVTITWEPQFVQTYIFPSWLAIPIFSPHDKHKI